MWQAAILPMVSTISGIILGQGSAQAQDYPNRYVTVINQTAAGSGPDVISRILGDRLGRVWGQQVVTLNRQGAAGLIAAQAAATSQPDGYTLYMPTSTAMVRRSIPRAKTIEPGEPLDLWPT